MKRITVVIYGGAVQDVLKSDGLDDVELVIKDYDLEEEDAHGNPQAKKDADGWYQEMKF